MLAIVIAPGEIVRVGDLEVSVQVSQRRKSIRLTVERDATLTAVIPPGTDTETLVKVVKAKRQWLYAKLRERAETGQAGPPRQFVTGEGFPYLGRSYRLLLVDDASQPVRLIRGRLELRRDDVPDAPRHLVRWYRKAGDPWLRKRVTPWAQRMSMEVTALRVLPLGYRWGSCTPDGKVNIHWATMQLPPELVDYVLVHELAHRRHLDHGEDFWRTVERALPDYQARRDRLRRAGPNLWLPESEATVGLALHARSGHGGAIAAPALAVPANLPPAPVVLGAPPTPEPGQVARLILEHTADVA